MKRGRKIDDGIFYIILNVIKCYPEMAQVLLRNDSSCFITANNPWIITPVIKRATLNKGHIELVIIKRESSVTYRVASKPGTDKFDHCQTRQLFTACLTRPATFDVRT